MSTTKRDRLKPVDLVKDRDYILSELEKSEKRGGSTSIETVMKEMDHYVKQL